MSAQSGWASNKDTRENLEQTERASTRFSKLEQTHLFEEHEASGFKWREREQHG